MSSNPGDVSMSQRIFDMNLPVEAVSLYLLCCALADAGAAITRETLSERWNGSDEALEREIAFLEKKNILCRTGAQEGSATAYVLMADKHWR